MNNEAINKMFNNAILDDLPKIKMHCNKDDIFKFLNCVPMEMGLSASCKGHITKIIHKNEE